MTNRNLEPDPSLYDEDEWQMLQSFENDDRPPEPAHKAHPTHWPEIFRAARLHGRIGPVPYDIPYPWAKTGAGSPNTDTTLAPNPPSGHNDAENAPASSPPAA